MVVMQKGSGKSVSLVLGSGGARGLSQIGVINALNDAGYNITSVIGSSIGALVGGIYALGELEAYENWVKGLSRKDVFSLLDWNFNGSGLVKGQTVMKKLQDLVGSSNIEDLGVNFIAVAVDMKRGREVWLNTGPLFDAIRASISIPGIFQPHQYRGIKLLDGGLLNPLPLAPALSTLSDLTIAVDLNLDDSWKKSEPEQSEPVQKPGSFLDRLTGLLDSQSQEMDGEEDNMIDVLLRSLEIVQQSMTQHCLSINKPDLLISVPTDACQMHEFHRARELIDLGRRLCEESLSTYENN